MKKIAKWFSGIVLLLIVIILLISFGRFPLTYMSRVLTYGNSDIGDIKVFSSETITKSDNPYYYSIKTIDKFGDRLVEYKSQGKIQQGPLSKVLEDNHTRAFIVIKDDAVVYEAYFNGGGAEIMETSFSSVKSMDSLLIGIAIQEGVIDSVQDTLDKYLPEFKEDARGLIKIIDLLRMRSPLRYWEGGLWFSDDAKTYYMPDLRTLALKETVIDNGYDGRFHYNNYHPLLLGLILERTTGKTPAAYFEEKIWHKVGAEYDASWSIDSEETAFPKMESGLNFRAIDFAKVGSALLHEGWFNNNEIVDSKWISASIETENIGGEDYKGSFLDGLETGYGFMWYSMGNGDGTVDYFAAGKYGQFLFVSPVNHVVIIRTGDNTGSVDWWPTILQTISGF